MSAPEARSGICTHPDVARGLGHGWRDDRVDRSVNLWINHRELMGNLLAIFVHRPCRFSGQGGLILPSITLALTLTFLIPSVQAAPPYRFDNSGYLGEAGLMPDWADTMARERSQAPGLDACLADVDACPRYYRGLRVLLEKAEALPPGRQISLISHYVNRKRYTRDETERIETALSEEPVRYRSRWTTVEEFMRRGGDCEDFATTKYYLLRRLGFSADQMRVVVTWDRGAGGYHAVLAVRHEGQVLLLESDNTIRRGSRHRFRFIYSINEESIWDHEAASASARAEKFNPKKKEKPA